MSDHHLKTWPGPFAEVRSGLKPFEYRVDDRGFKVGDRLFLEEWDPETGQHTGEVEVRTVGYMLVGGKFGIPPSYVVMAFLASAAERDVAAERRRQVEVEGWTPEHDDQHTGGGMALAAACYTLDAALKPRGDGSASWLSAFLQRSWPWAWKWWKPKTPRANLVRAGALIAAEIERIDRAAARGRDAT